jgi:hypothetical protein
MKLKKLYPCEFPFRCNNLDMEFIIKKTAQSGESYTGYLRSLIEAERQRENAFNNLLKPKQ